MTWRSITDLSMADYHTIDHRIELALERLRKQAGSTSVQEIVGFLRTAIEVLERERP